MEQSIYYRCLWLSHISAYAVLKILRFDIGGTSGLEFFCGLILNSTVLRLCGPRGLDFFAAYVVRFKVLCALCSLCSHILV